MAWRSVGRDYCSIFRPANHTEAIIWWLFNPVQIKKGRDPKEGEEPGSRP